MYCLSFVIHVVILFYGFSCGLFDMFMKTFYKVIVNWHIVFSLSNTGPQTTTAQLGDPIKISGTLQ